MELVIDRTKWRRGGSKRDFTDGETALLNNQGMMCCLGSACIASGLSRGQILGEPEPWSVGNLLKHRDKFGLIVDVTNLVTDEDYSHNYNHSELTTRAMCINDDECLSEEMREEKLISLFAANNIALSFIN